MSTEQSVDVENLDPVTAIRMLAELTFDRHEANPNFSRLVSHENMQQRPVRTAASGFPGLERPVIRMLEKVLDAVAPTASSNATSTPSTSTC